MRGLVDKQVVIVTGCANQKGIGYATVEALINHNARVVIMIDIEPSIVVLAERLSRESNTVVEGFYADVSDEVHLKKIVDEVIRKHGRIDSVVNNAAINTPGTAVDTSRDAFTKTMMVNVWPLISMTGLVVPHMIKQGGGAVVNVSSANAYVSEYGLLPYVTSKGAVMQATQQMGLEYAKHNIRINAVAPGALHSGFNAPHYIYTGDSEEAVNAVIGDIHPTGRIIQPWEIAMPILFLCSRYATASIGSTVVSDAGFSIK